MNAKLNIIAKDLIDEKLKTVGEGEEREALLKERDFYEIDALKFTPEAPDPDKANMPTNRNHHYDLLFRCDPKQVVIHFLAMNKNTDPPLWWQYELKFRRTAANLNVYTAQMRTKTGITFYVRPVWAFIAAIVNVFLFATCFLPELIAAFLYFPIALIKLKNKSQPFKKTISDIIDPLGYRVMYMPWCVVVLENLCFFFVVTGYVLSFFAVFSRSGSYAIYIAFEKQASLWEMFGREVYLSGWDKLQNIVFLFWAKELMHGIAVLFIFLRLLEVTLRFRGTNFLLLTFVFCLWPLLNFMLIFTVLVGGYALMVHAVAGDHFVQFDTPASAFYTFFCYAFELGDISQAEASLKTWEDPDGWKVAMLLLVFKLMVVMVLLNMFTTIIIDAYSTAIDKNKCKERLKQSVATSWFWAKGLFGYEHEQKEDAMHVGDSELLSRLGLDYSNLDAASSAEKRNNLRETLKEQYNEIKELMSQLSPVIEQIQIPETVPQAATNQ
eukprot:GHVR01139996.1.p1 GENE.GHVR01139996.1~~GHVR01139996.1.p1  ORF type:complete len:496 (+),score=84.19 GHVR01139996.1:133-1620(+)